MNVARQLLNSEKAVTIGLLVVGATVLTALGIMSVEQWSEYTQVMAGIYVGGKTVQGVAQVMGARGKVAAQVGELEARVAELEEPEPDEPDEPPPAEASP